MNKNRRTVLAIEESLYELERPCRKNNEIIHKPRQQLAKRA